MVQIFLIVLLSGIFVLIFFYYVFNESQVDRIDIFLTVIVGWLGAIIGKFFGEKAMGNLEVKRKIHTEKVNLVLNKYGNLLDQLLSEKK